MRRSSSLSILTNRFINLHWTDSMRFIPLRSSGDQTQEAFSRNCLTYTTSARIRFTSVSLEMKHLNNRSDHPVLRQLWKIANVLFHRSFCFLYHYQFMTLSLLSQSFAKFISDKIRWFHTSLLIDRSLRLPLLSFVLHLGYCT